ncbi:SGNH/GDSL hydrolase family protein [Haloferula sp. A504]|uniref:SGNH/GDSL hydrolase family protein n=1 Tax=Haloferula sp. A504 TaxID=3373601 RepID=UPI0031BF88A9|nr:SGNH/GDSL hydrolase family protein [Verrucomicrobiaceae bacterium E54]
MRTQTLSVVVFRLAFTLIALAGLTPQAHAESALLAKVRDGDDVKVVLLGTSLTDNGTWPASLQTWLTSESPGPGTVTVVNRAAGGEASDHGLAVQTPAALLDNPDCVFIEFSMNDAATSKNITLQQSEDNLNAMIDAFVAQNPDVIIVLQTMNNLPPDTSPFSPRVNLNGYYQIYRDVAAARGAILIDHYPNWLDLYTNDLATWQSYMEDAVHPNPLGQDQVLFPELQAVLGPPAAPPSVSDTLIFQDDFDGAGGSPLDGTTPDVTQGSTVWVADAEYEADGSALINTENPSRRAYLTLGNLIDDNRGNADALYTLSATINVPPGTTGIWEAIGFWNNDTPLENFGTGGGELGGQPRGTAWMLRRDNAQIRVFRGVGLGGTLTESTASPNNVAGTLDFKVVLDLTDWNGTDNWGSVTYSAKLSTDSTFTEIAAGELDAANSTFRAVGLGGGTVGAQVSSFELTKLSLAPPELADFSYDGTTGNAEVRIIGAANTRYKLVRADDLDFATPDQDPLPLTGATVGGLDGGGVITDPGGNATVQFNLGTGASAFIRAEEQP